MDSLSICLSSSPPLQSHPRTHKPTTSKSLSRLPNFIHSSNPTSQSFNSNQTHVSSFKKTPHLPLNYSSNLQPNKSITTHHPSNPFPNHLLIHINPSFPQISLTPHLSFVLMGLSVPLSCFASETTTVPTEQVSDKINLESILVSIDEFFNRNPFFVAGVTFIWLVVIPLTQLYFKKFKFVSAIDAFRKLQDDPNSQLLDIRDKKILVSTGSPNLKILNKGVVQVPFSEGDEEGFVKKVLGNFTDPETTTICVLDNFDGNSMKVAELLFKNGFKEAYAIKGGVRGKNGWQEIQETLLPPSVHIYPKKKVKMSQQLEMNGGVNQRSEDKASSSTSVPIGRSETMDHGYVNSMEPTPQAKRGSRSSSPYPNYPDLKPPASPTPSKPQN